MVSICNDRLIWSCILRGLICHGNRYLLSNNASSIIVLIYPLKKSNIFNRLKSYVKCLLQGSMTLETVHPILILFSEQLVLSIQTLYILAGIPLQFP